MNFGLDGHLVTQYILSLVSRRPPQEEEENGKEEQKFLILLRVCSCGEKKRIITPKREDWNLRIGCLTMLQIAFSTV